MRTIITRFDNEETKQSQAKQSTSLFMQVPINALARIGSPSRRNQEHDEVCSEAVINASDSSPKHKSQLLG